MRGEMPHAVIMAGCTDLMVVDYAQRRTHDAVIDLLPIAEICGIVDEGNGLRIGATTTFRTIGGDSRIQERYPMLAAAARTIGGWQIQNRATIGGNIVNASPAGDSLPVLLALDARLTLVGPAGPRELDYASMHVGYRQTALRNDEIVGWIHLPEAPEVQSFRKVGTRAAQAISKVVVAFSARRDGAASGWRQTRVAAGSVASTPIRLGGVEALLESEAAESGVALETRALRAARAAGAAVQPIDDVRSTAEYRRHVLERVLHRMVLETG